MGLRIGKSVPFKLDVNGDGTDDIEIRVNLGRRLVNSVSVKHIRSKVGYNTRTGFFRTIVRGWASWR